MKLGKINKYEVYKRDRSNVSLRGVVCWYCLMFCMVGIFSNSLIGQSIEFVYAPSGENTGTCMSASDSLTDTQCYFIRYTPSATGTLTSYTQSYFGTCGNGVSPYIGNISGSCVMTNNSSEFDQCSSQQLFLLNLSANNGSLSITQGVPVNIHQVCFDITLGDTLNLFTDGDEALTYGITAPNGEAITDVLSLPLTPLTNEFSCEEIGSTVCNIGFGKSANRIEFDTLVGGDIANGASLINAIVPAQTFDIFNEVNGSCLSGGGDTDITIIFQILNTLDVNGNGSIDDLAGENHKLIQTSNGLVAEIPFNESSESESSAGDVRGYSIEVQFASHVQIIADQLSIMVEGMNSAGTIFESAQLIFLDQSYTPYGTAIHNGFFNGENDLSGSCSSTTPSAVYTTGGNGVVVLSDQATVDLLAPCNPAIGIDGANNNLDVNAREHAGLDSMALIGGFKLIVLGEDVASPSSLDDGSGTGGDDGIRANVQTNATGTLTSLLKGMKIEGCVGLEAIVLPLRWLEFEVHAKNNGALILWTTTDEVNTDFFNVEWSIDGQLFQSIGEVNAINEFGENQYQFTHHNPTQGRNYYRIKQADIDGRFSHSDVKILNVMLDNPEVYPNPTSGNLYINYNDIEFVNYNLKIYDLSGTTVYTSELYEESINLAMLSKGFYILEIYANGQKTTHRLVKIE